MRSLRHFGIALLFLTAFNTLALAQGTADIVGRVTEPKPKSLSDIGARPVGVIEESVAEYLLAAEDASISTGLTRLAR